MYTDLSDNEVYENFKEKTLNWFETLSEDEQDVLLLRFAADYPELYPNDDVMPEDIWVKCQEYPDFYRFIDNAMKVRA